MLAIWIKAGLLRLELLLLLLRSSVRVKASGLLSGKTILIPILVASLLVLESGRLGIHVVVNVACRLLLLHLADGVAGPVNCRLLLVSLVEARRLCNLDWIVVKQRRGILLF